MERIIIYDGGRQYAYLVVCIIPGDPAVYEIVEEENEQPAAEGKPGLDDRRGI